MKVKAATVEEHAFAIRRRGYDRAEVDAVMGQVGRSLRSYEEESTDHEARVSQAANHAITASFATVQEAGQKLAEQTRMESEAMMRQAEEAVAGARQQAEAILAAAKDAIEKMFDSIAGEAEQVLETAERDAAEHKIKIEEESAKLLADSTAEAERLREEAGATRAEAEAIREAAASEAAELRAEVALEAAATIAKARSEHDRLANRIPELRTALSQFEAQVHALAEVPAIDLNQLEAAEALAEVEVTVAADAEDPVGPAEAAIIDDEATPADAIPVPDGSGTLPAARQLVDLDAYRELKTSPVADESVDEAAEVVAMEVEPEPALVADNAGTPLERLAASHVASRAIPTDNETIYQRRGGGLRRRIKAQGDE